VTLMPKIIAAQPNALIAPAVTLKIHNAAFIITMNRERTILRNASIIIAADRIIGVGRAAEMEPLIADKVIDATGMVVIPGMCDGHIHMSYAHAVRGLFPDDLERSDYVSNVFRLQALMTEEEEYFTTLLALIEMVKNGTTCLLDPGSTKFLDVCIDAYRLAGVRAIVGIHVADSPTTLHLPVLSTEHALKKTDECISRYHGSLSGRIKAWAMPFSARLASKELLIGAKELADYYDTGLTMHQNFPEYAVTEFIQKYKRRPVEMLAEWGVLDSNVLLAHLTGINAAEIEAILKKGACGVVCPAAAMKLGEGLTSSCPLPELLACGIAIGLGTDSANNANALDIIRTMYLAAIAFKDGRRDTSIITAEGVLEMATCGGARALGLDSEIGSIEIGKKADLVLLNTHRAEWRNLLNPVSNLVYCSDGRSVHTVIVNGEVVVRNHQITFSDESEIIEKMDSIWRRLLRRSGISVTHRWPIL
jgi:5-methylthioadenosine/S-adenosylhomocysteine deaminase